MTFNIFPLERVIGAAIKGMDFSEASPTKAVSYSWGDQKELVQWQIMKNKETSGLRAFQQKVNPKYPLIWMVDKWVGNAVSQREHLFTNLKFVVCCDTKAEWLNTTREKETMPILTSICEVFLENISRNKNLSIKRENGYPAYSYQKIPNYSSGGNENESTDIWDAILLKFDLITNNNCLKTIELCQ
ncbi:hypothetical protein [Chryseobacterium sp. R2A-55]|uniref:hypothetical protein n=1 Tax=Chryseobacterium sp. R2A-55 TaxID=2744445 RepID=UPI001F3D8B6A|nr:hypothetical protein [Chryseobacterium sp. R2A-55]